MTDYIKLVYSPEQFKKLNAYDLVYGISELFGDDSEYELNDNCLLINGHSTEIKLVNSNSFDLIFEMDEGIDLESDEEEELFDEICENIWNIFGTEVDIDSQNENTIRVSNCNVKIE